MRKKRAKKLKKLAQSIMHGKSAEEIKKFYRRLKSVK